METLRERSAASEARRQTTRRPRAQNGPALPRGQRSQESGARQQPAQSTLGPVSQRPRVTSSERRRKLALADPPPEYRRRPMRRRVVQSSG